MNTILCWLWPLIAGILCAILGYLLGRLSSSKWKNKYKELKEEYNKCVKKDKKQEEKYEQKVSELKAQLETCENSTNGDNDLALQLSSLQNDLVSSKNNFVSLESDLSTKNNRISELEAQLAKRPNSFAGVLFNATAAKAVFGKKINQDDLKVVEGIGPKIEELFHNYGIKTWKALSESSLEIRKDVLKNGGDRYKMHNPGTWADQAKLAFEGKWAELLKWQDELDGGK